MTTYKLEELAREAGVAARTVRYYVQRGLLPAPAFRGKDTTYDEKHLLRLRAIKCLQQVHLPLDAIQSRILAASPKELEAIVSGMVQLQAPLAPPARLLPEPEAEPEEEEKLDGGSVWGRFEIVPGIELHVKGDASAKVKRIARKILKKYRDRAAD